jgi:hypothetical protein
MNGRPSSPRATVESASAASATQGTRLYIRTGFAIEGNLQKGRFWQAEAAPHYRKKRIRGHEINRFIN